MGIKAQLIYWKERRYGLQRIIGIICLPLWCVVLFIGSMMGYQDRSFKSKTSFCPDCLIAIAKTHMDGRCLQCSMLYCPSAYGTCLAPFCTQKRYELNYCSDECKFWASLFPNYQIKTGIELKEEEPSYICGPGRIMRIEHSKPKSYILKEDFLSVLNTPPTLP